MAELRELSVNQFVEETASKAAVPGGGSVSAMVGALGAALMEMVANLTIGKEKYAGVQEEMQALAAEGAALPEELLAGIKKKISKDKIRETISEVGLDPDDKRPIRKYSLGMRQRILIAQAIMEEPDVLLLDEPTNGLDDSGVDEIRKLISAQAKRGAIVCVASHNKEDIALLSDKIFRVDNGAVREE